MKSGKYLGMGLLLLLPLLCQCATGALVGVGAGAGFGSYSYVKGELRLDYPYAYDQTWNATLTAVERLGIQVSSQARDSLGGKITGKRPDGKSVVIKVKDKGLGVSTVAVRVGTFGHREGSQKIQETIINVLRS
jgi:hypothetical protein